LYILGDLFEDFWTGADDITPPNPEIISELLDFTSNGGRLFFLRGNRELMLDHGFEEVTGCALLPDQSVIKLHGKDILITHGDLLCTRDRKYQIFRSVMENAAVKRIFRTLPGRLRVLLAHGLQPAMRRSMKLKSDRIMDADPATVEQLMRTHRVSELIHGHTHRPAVHEFTLDGKKARRIVLGDWYDQGMILVCSDGHRRLLPVREFLDEDRKFRRQTRRLSAVPVQSARRSESD